MIIREVFVCPKCKGKKQIEDKEEAVPSPGIGGIYYPPCYVCNEKGFVVVETEI
jgi:hypothetical protein